MDDEPALPPRARSPSARTVVGLIVVLVLLGMAVAPLLILRHRHTAGPSMTDPRGALSEAAARERAATMTRVRAVAAAASLASSIGALAEVAAARKTAEEPMTDPPLPTEFASPTACMASYLPEADLRAGSLDFVCTDTELWSIERKAYARIAPRRGDGARSWTELGHYSLAVLATLRSGCCVDPEPLTAVVPGLWCGILRDKLGAFGPVPTLDAVTEFDATMQCLAERGARLPPTWKRFSHRRSAAAFRRVMDAARHRHTAR